MFLFSPPLSTHFSDPGLTIVILYWSVFLRPGYLPFRLYWTQLHDSLPDFPVTPISPTTSRNISIGFQSLLALNNYKVLLIVLKAQMGVAPKYYRDAIRLPTSATSLRPLRSMDRRELFVPRTRTTMAMSRSFSVIAPSLWNRLPPSARASLLSSNLPTSLSLLKTCLFSWS